jgi:uridine kinase
MSPQSVCFVGVAGGSGAGKTVLVRELVTRFGADVLDLDSYYLDRGGIPVEERERLNYDEPAAVDVGLLLEHLERLRRAETVRKPVYSFQSHTRIGEQRVAPARVMVVEGLFTLWWPTVREYLDVKIFVDAPADIRLARRVRRDVSERGRTVDHVLEQYVASVRPMHDMYVEPCRAFADIVVTNDGSVGGAVAALLAAVGRMATDRLGTLTVAGTTKD